MREGRSRPSLGYPIIATATGTAAAMREGRSRPSLIELSSCVRLFYKSRNEGGAKPPLVVIRAASNIVSQATPQ